MWHWPHERLSCWSRWRELRRRKKRNLWRLQKTCKPWRQTSPPAWRRWNRCRCNRNRRKWWYFCNWSRNCWRWLLWNNSNSYRFLSRCRSNCNCKSNYCKWSTNFYKHSKCWFRLYGNSNSYY